MSGSSDRPNAENCSPCEGAPEPQARYNPPGQSSIAYRLATYGEFFERMTARLHAWVDPELGTRPFADLTTRSLDDPTIAMLDAFAVTGDVLTFYQERIAQEGFLRTATERRSILELARSIGYELAPGLAATAHLAFTVEEVDDAVIESVVPAGTPIQSIPAADGELPQTFETEKDLPVSSAWNALRPVSGRPQVTDTGTTRLYLSGIGHRLSQGDAVLMFVGGTPQFARVFASEEDGPAGRTRVDLGRTPVTTTYTEAPFTDGFVDVDQETLALSRTTVRDEIYAKNWDEASLHTFLSQHDWDRDLVCEYVADLLAEDYATGDMVAFRSRAKVFGHNAANWRHLSSAAQLAYLAADESGTRPGLTEWPSFTIFAPRLPLTYTSLNSLVATEMVLDDLAPAPDTVPEVSLVYQTAIKTSDTVSLDSAYDESHGDDWIALRARGRHGVFAVQEVSEAARAEYGLSADSTRIQVSTSATSSSEAGLALSSFSSEVRACAVFCQNDALPLGALPVEDDLPIGTTTIELDRMVLGLSIGRTLAFQGEEVGADEALRVEILTIEEIHHLRGRTTLTFTTGLSRNYVRSSVALNANVGLASHGKTVAFEVGASGDASQTGQSFPLSRPLLTHVQAPGTASGAASTLRLWADGVEWNQVDSFYGVDPDARAFTVRIDDNAVATVSAGDWINGAAFPTGSENVLVTFRNGIGSVGEVGAGALILLTQRPYGVRSVENPLPASGSADPEKLADARANAPLHVLTLDRIVSLQDYEDFARAYAGIGKARAESVWDGNEEVVHITVCDPRGGLVEPPLDASLLTSIEAARDPLRGVRLATHAAVFFRMSCELLVDGDRLWDDVAGAVQSALIELFSFDRRNYVQHATSAEALAAIHSVPGARAARVSMWRADDPLEVASQVLVARRARYHSRTASLRPAELLLLDPLGLTITEMTS